MEMSLEWMEKKRDDLQSAMQLIEDLQVGIPVQFINFRD